MKTEYDAEQYMPRMIDVTAGDLPEDQKKPRRRKCLLAILLTLLILLLLALILLAIILLILLGERKATATTIKTNASTIFTTSSTTIINCVLPNVLAPSGICVNTLIDFNNCGAVGNICPSNYTSCSAGVCSTAPVIQLANASAIWLAAVNGSVDDDTYNATLPWNITLYNTTTRLVTVTTNGVLCLGGCSNAYGETTLPASTFSGATAMPFWDDLYIYANTTQGIYYGSEGNAPNRTLIFEYYMSHYQQPDQYYHFQVIFFEAAPGIVQYKYFEATDGGATCTIGVQASSSGPFIMYSYDQANSVQSNMTLIFNTNLGTYTKSTTR